MMTMMTTMIIHGSDDSAWMYSSGRAAEGEGGSDQLDGGEGGLATAVGPSAERYRARLPGPLRAAGRPRGAAGQRAARPSGPARRTQHRRGRRRTAAGHAVPVRSSGDHAQGPRRAQSAQKSPH